MSQDREHIALLRALFQQQAEALKARDRGQQAHYLEAHSRTDSAILRQLWAVKTYLPHVRGRVLEWGCMHAPDSCLLRILGATDLDLHGCDVHKAGAFDICHQYCGLNYRPLDHWARLPYPDAYFDTVIADGVLEHVPNDAHSLAEVYRVMKPGGRFIICCLPNRYSIIEAVSRWMGIPHHPRTYSLTQAKTMLLHSGFQTIAARYYQIMPTLSGISPFAARPWIRRIVDGLWCMNPLMEAIYPLNRLASNLYLVSEKCTAIQWLPHARNAA